MNQAPLASIIVPAWNGKDFLEACLNSLLAQDYPKFEVIVVDNASSDGTPDWVAQQFPTVILIRNEDNLGFAGGVNVGLRAAKGDILVLFNQDAIAEPGWLSALVSGLLTTPDAGVAGSKILNVNSQVIQHAGGCLTVPQAQPSHFGFNELDTGQYNQPRDVDYVTGAALALRRQVLETIGYFDETFFFYYEDVDYCYRAQAAGFRVVYLPQAVLYHHGNTSLGPGTVAHYANFHASRLQFVIKHRSVPYFVSQFQPVEQAWFKNIPSLEERMGLRQAYQTIILKIAKQSSQDPAPTNGSQTERLNALRQLRQEIFTAYLNEAWLSLDKPPDVPGTLAKPWWHVQERAFVSQTPLIGPLIVRFRTAWNDVSTKWFVRLILQQQNHVNRILAQRLEIQERILYNQGQFLIDLDRDQTYLTTQLIEVIRRLDKIEARLMALEQKG